MVNTPNLGIELVDDGDTTWGDAYRSAMTTIDSWFGGTAGTIRSGTGNPEGVVTAPVGALYRRTDGGTGTSLWVKESGTGNTGWKAVVTGLGSSNVLVPGSLEVDGALDHDGSTVGFYGTAPAAKPTVSGQRNGSAGLASALTALAALGLLTDSTTAGAATSSGTGSPEGVVTATVGAIYQRTDGGVGTTLYVKETGSGNTGWEAIGTAGDVLIGGALELDGALNHDGTTAGFYGTAPAAKPTISGDRAGNAALASFLTALSGLGLITNSTTDSGGGGTTVPAGVVAAFGGTAAPTGWLMCDGAAVSRSTYAALFTAIGTAYGAGNGSTTFNVPDMRQRFPLGKAASGTGATLGGTGGTIGHGHTVSSHSHPVSVSGSTGANGGHAHDSHSTASNFSTGGTTRQGLFNPVFHSNPGDHTHSFGDSTSTSSGGSSSTTSNDPPFQAVNYIVKT